MKNKKNFIKWSIIFIIIFGIGLIKKEFQNDTFYTIKIGELIFNNGIDMLDHFSIHEGLAYTYPHWLYDCFIYLMYSLGGFIGIHISTILLFALLIYIVYKTNKKITNNITVTTISTLICVLAISSFVTARAQLFSFILFALQIYLIESYLKDNKKKHLYGLLFISLLLCNTHVAVWPFYFILYLPYLAEYIIALICSKIKLKKESKFITFLKKKFIIDNNKNIKFLFITMLLSTLTGLITPLRLTPYTYLINTMMGNSQSYILEHQMIGWLEAPFTIIIAGETIILALISKVKLRDLFMITGLTIMAIFSARHLSLLALIGIIAYARTFSLFFENFEFDVDNIIINFFCKKTVYITAFILVVAFTGTMTFFESKKEYVNEKLYPTEAIKYIKNNIDTEEMRLFNEYNFGSYLLLNNIKVFIDARADLYTKEFSGLNYDIFDEFYYINLYYTKIFNKHGITHVLLYKDTNLNEKLKTNFNYEVIYEDEYFKLYERKNTQELEFTIN